MRKKPMCSARPSFIVGPRRRPINSCSAWLLGLRTVAYCSGIKAPPQSLQSDIGHAAEEAATLVGFSGVDVEPALKYEHALHTVSEVFGTPKSPAGAGDISGSHAIDAVSIPGLVIGVFDAAINYAIQGHFEMGQSCGTQQGERHAAA